jgi:hypothetical protein
MKDGMLIPPDTVTFPESIVKSYLASKPDFRGYMKIMGFVFNEDGNVNVEVSFTQNDIWRKLGINNNSQPWCNQNGTAHFNIAAYGMCQFDGPDPTYDWYKQIMYSGLANDCVGQRPGICRVFKIGRDGTSTEGTYVESQDGPAAGGALEFVGNSIKLNWALCPNGIVDEQVVATPIPPKLPVCNAISRSDNVYAETVNFTADMLVNYAASQPYYQYFLKVEGFTFLRNGNVDVTINFLQDNIWSKMNMNNHSQPWCNQNGTAHFNIAVYGMCTFNGPDPNYNWYKAILYSQLANDCTGQRPGICRIIKIGKKGTVAEGKYVESQDGPATGGALEFDGEEVTLKWETCPTEILQEQVVATVAPATTPASCPVNMTDADVPIQMALFNSDLLHAYNASKPFYPTFLKIDGFQFMPDGHVNVTGTFLQDNIWSKMGVNTKAQPWCNKQGPFSFTIYVYGLCKYDGPDPNFNWYKAIMYSQLANDCTGQRPGLCRIVKVGKPGTAAEGQYVESQDGPARGGAIEFSGDEMRLHWDDCPTTIVDEQVKATIIL